MAKSDTVEAAAARAASELRRELQRLVRMIAEDEDGRIETYEEAARALAALKDLKISGAGGGGGSGGRGGDTKGKGSSPLARERKKKEEGMEIEPVAIPQHFLCPISSQLMRDPVVVASGQTYDRSFIQGWLNSGSRTCPQTQQVLSDITLTPNHLVRGMIYEWCIEHGVTLPAPVETPEEEGLVTRGEQNALDELLHKISSPSIPDRKQAIKELRLLTKRNRSVRALIGEKPEAIQQLLAVPSMPGLNDDLEVQEDTVTTILNLSIHESNKKTVADNPEAIPLLIGALKTGNMETRRNAAAALFSLSALDSNKSRIAELGAMRPLLDLLDQGSPAAKKDAASAVFNLCVAHENKSRAVRDGAVEVVLKAIAGRALADESLAILALLSSDPEAVEEIGERGGVGCLLRIVKESSSSARSKENAVVVLFSVCMHDRAKLAEVGEEERANATISWLAQNGTPRARRKAAGILDRWRRGAQHGAHNSC